MSLTAPLTPATERQDAVERAAPAGFVALIRGASPVR
jgi:hypothetical protein